MSCFKKRKYKKNTIHPSPPPFKEKKVDEVFVDTMLKEALVCGGCNKAFSLRSNEIKIHCNICNQFFHCKIAGECVGEDCSIMINGKKHRASYCYMCAKILYQNNECLCSTCCE